MPLHHSLHAFTILHLTLCTVSPHMNTGHRFWIRSHTQQNRLPQTDLPHEFHNILFRLAFWPAVQAAQCKNSQEADGGGEVEKLQEGGTCHWLVPCHPPPPPLLLVCVTIYCYMTVRFVESNAGTTVFILFDIFAMETCNNTRMNFSVFICSRSHSLWWKCRKGPSFYTRFFHICNIDILTMLMFLKLLSVTICLISALNVCVKRI
jgi:hypothetical protein